MDVAIGEEPSTPLPRGEGGPLGGRSSPAERRGKTGGRVKAQGTRGRQPERTSPHTPTAGPSAPWAPSVPSDLGDRRVSLVVPEVLVPGPGPPAISEPSGTGLFPHAAGRPPSEA